MEFIKLTPDKFETSENLEEEIIKSDQSDSNNQEVKPKEHSEKDNYVAGFKIIKEGIFLSNSDKYFVEIKRHWQNFCNISYQDHENPPAETIFLDFFKKKLAVGKSAKLMVETYRCLCKVYLYLYGQEFDSSKVMEFIKLNGEKTEKVESNKDPGICPHCGEVSFIYYLFIFFRTKWLQNHFRILRPIPKLN